MKLKEARQKAGYGRPKASRLANIDYPGLYRIETGTRVPRIETALRISEALGLDPWAIDEFRPALEQTKALGLVAPATKDGLENAHKEEQE